MHLLLIDLIVRHLLLIEAPATNGDALHLTLIAMHLLLIDLVVRHLLLIARHLLLIAMHCT